MFSLPPNIPIQYIVHTAYCLMRAGNKGPGFENEKTRPTNNMKDELLIPPFPLLFVQGEIYIHCLLIKGV
jgi:hypothetical protein